MKLAGRLVLGSAIYNQQDRIGADRNRFKDLSFIDDKILAQDWQRHGFADGSQVLTLAAKIILLRQH